MYILYVVAAILIFDLFTYLLAFNRLRKVKKQYPDLYVIGYKNKLLFL